MSSQPVRRESDIITSKEEGNVHWAIDRSRLQQLRDNDLSSDTFTFSGAKFRFYLRKIVDPTVFNVSLCQINDSPPPNLYVNIRMKIKRRYVITMEQTTSLFTKEINIMFSLSDLKIRLDSIRLSDLEIISIFCQLRRLSEVEMPLVVKEILPIKEAGKGEKDSNTYLDEEEKVSQYKIKEAGKEEKDSNTYLDKKEKVSQYKTIKKLQKDLNDLFLSGEDCDCTLKVLAKEFSAHKIILKARSPVFKSMFSHDMKEKRSGVVAIDDCDPKTFPDFLKYLYSGSTEHINEKNVCHLYTASDKYQVEELKQECAEFMQSHLSVETFCDFFTSALKHSEKELIESATKFFCGNTLKIAETPKWQIFLEENSTVGNELFLKALSRGRMT